MADEFHPKVLGAAQPGEGGLLAGCVCHGSRHGEWQPCVKHLPFSLGWAVTLYIHIPDFRSVCSVADTSNPECTKENNHLASPSTVFLGFPVFALLVISLDF